MKPARERRQERSEHCEEQRLETDDRANQEQRASHRGTAWRNAFVSMQARDATPATGLVKSGRGMILGHDGGFAYFDTQQDVVRVLEATERPARYGTLGRSFPDRTSGVRRGLLALAPRGRA